MFRGLRKHFPLKTAAGASSFQADFPFGSADARMQRFRSLSGLGLEGFLFLSGSRLKLSAPSGYPELFVGGYNNAHKTCSQLSLTFESLRWRAKAALN